MLLLRVQLCVPNCKIVIFLHCNRYGSFFKTHILGSPTIICMDPVMNRYVLLHEGKGLVPGYPRSLVELLGKRNISAVHGTAHRYIRSSMLSLIGPTVIKERLLIDVDEFMRCHLHNLDGNTIDIQDKTKQVCSSVRSIPHLFFPLLSFHVVSIFL